jgi:small-conductance mechanosensitive channel
LRNLVLLLVLVLGLVSGYFLGDYRGSQAIATLKEAAETGKTVEKEREARMVALKKDLDDINAKYTRDMEASRRDFQARTAEWQRTKVGLDETIKRQNARLAASSKNIDDLKVRLAGASGAEKTRLEEEIARMQKQRSDLQRELDGTRCLQTPVPRSVLDALGGAAAKGGG